MSDDAGEKKEEIYINNFFDETRFFLELIKYVRRQKKMFDRE